MAVTMRKAIPTEYAGIRYRSKSEAQFAFAFQFRGLNRTLQYEPNYLTVEDWIPDFLLLTQVDIGGEIDADIIELKPATPTNTYLENLAPKMQASMRCLNFDVVGGTVWSGSFYKSSSFHIWQLISNSELHGDCFFEHCREFEFGPEVQDEVLKYRFDLNHG